MVHPIIGHRPRNGKAYHDAAGHREQQCQTSSVQRWLRPFVYCGESLPEEPHQQAPQLVDHLCCNGAPDRAVHRTRPVGFHTEAHQPGQQQNRDGKCQRCHQPLFAKRTIMKNQAVDRSQEHERRKGYCKPHPEPFPAAERQAERRQRTPIDDAVPQHPFDELYQSAPHSTPPT